MPLEDNGTGVHPPSLDAVVDWGDPISYKPRLSLEWRFSRGILDHEWIGSNT